MKTLKELVQGQVFFVEYRKGNLWYSTNEPDAFVFPVPIEDTGDATFKDLDKGIFFMRYIRKHLEAIKNGNNIQ